MKYILSGLILLIVSNSWAQTNKLLLDEKLISDLSETPIYSRLIDEVDGKTQWKEEFKYLDSIEIYSITYLSDGLKVKGFLVKPKKKGNYPCIIFNRGGNRDFGSLKIAHGVYTLGQLAKEGYIVIASQYRGNGGGEGQEEFGGKDVNDVLTLIDVLKEVKGADAKNIGMYGWSRGGMMTYIALTKTNDIKAAVVGGALADCFSNIEDRDDMETEVYSQLVPDYKTNKEEELEKRSAVKWVEKFPKNVPVLVLHGTSDWRVKPEQSLKMAMEFEKYRIPFRLIMFEGGDHGILEHRDEVDVQVLSWFNRFLKNNEQIPNMEYHGK